MDSLFAQNVLEVLAVLFLHQEELVHQSKIAQLTGLRKMEAQRALQRLLDDGIIEENQHGNMVCYSLQKNHPLFQDLKSILYKTILMAEPFKKRFADIAEDIDIAFIYGSVASGTESPASDIDLFIVGKLGLMEISKIISPIAEKLQKEINPVVYTKSEFSRRYSLQDHFLTSVLRSEKIWIIGDENDLKKIAR